MNKYFFYFPPRKWQKSLALSTFLFMAIFMANSLNAQTVVLNETQAATTIESISNYANDVEANMKIQKHNGQQTEFEQSKRVLKFYNTMIKDITLQKAVSQAVLDNLAPNHLIAILENQSSQIGTRTQIQTKN